MPISSGTLSDSKQEKGKACTSSYDVRAKDDRVRRALDLMHSDCSAPVGDVAAHLNLSASGFRHLFKKEMGIAPIRYLKLVRLERAKELLQDSFLRIKEITAHIGANDVSHFVREYKALFGETPSATRRRRSLKTCA